MMKRIIGLALVCGVLFVGCDANLTKIPKKIKYPKLIIKNQSSINISCVMYGDYSLIGVDDVLIPGGEIDEEFILDRDKEGKIGYIFFSLLDGYRWEDTIFEVRTNEIVHVDNENTTTFIITDNTLVIPKGMSQTFTILDLMTPATLEIVNNTSYPMYNVRFMGVQYASYGKVLSRGKSDLHKFYKIENESEYINFEIRSPKYFTRIAVKTTGKPIKLEKGKQKIINIEENTLLYSSKYDTVKTIGELIELGDKL